ncbi:MAG TPA: NADH-quinone oxidoreductase subunit NuoK [Stackebrandtia sp.]|uniref:NADH-quinone oxidoreductase subunit NuoK n=1 Tax=Stackebrandtia sp. TaxID=2023065 RepID=UPI002D692A61|nr:NADH-quinone oxidoreductase subunit NuoK [Stackebrandtia sp.]HZE37989.1 NADH-quinone oxidoreductase subunit NuoK [Stackebrandtia sp.]
MHPVIPYVLAALLFGVGVYGVLVRRNAVLMLAAVELMLGAVNLVLVTADVAPLRGPASGHTGQSFALFIIVIAAAEIGVGLALVLRLFRVRDSIDTDGVDADDAPATSDREVA